MTVWGLIARHPSVMKMSITHHNAKASIFCADGEHFHIGDVLEKFVTPLLLAAGFQPETIEEGYEAAASNRDVFDLPDRNAVQAEPDEPSGDGIWIRLPDVPEGFEFVGVIGSIDDREDFNREDLLFLGDIVGEWGSCTSFHGQYPYAARIGSAAHKHALEYYPQH